MLMLVGMMVFVGCGKDKDGDSPKEVDYMDLTYTSNSPVDYRDFFEFQGEPIGASASFFTYNYLDYDSYFNIDAEDYVDDFDSKTVYYKEEPFNGTALVYYREYYQETRDLENPIFAKITYVNGIKHYTEFYDDYLKDGKLDLKGKGYYDEQGRRDGEWYIHVSVTSDPYNPSYVNYNNGILDNESWHMYSEKE